jgi:hypothetical protein
MPPASAAAGVRATTVRSFPHGARNRPDAPPGVAARHFAASEAAIRKERAMEQSAATKSFGPQPPVFMEHRWGQRMPCRALVRLSAGFDINGAGRVRDISSSGAFIETALELAVHTRLVLFVLGNESAARAAEFTASVVRVDRDGVGVEWCDSPAGSICTAVGCKTRCAQLRTR